LGVKEKKKGKKKVMNGILKGENTGKIGGGKAGGGGKPSLHKVGPN